MIQVLNSIMSYYYTLQWSVVCDSTASLVRSLRLYYRIQECCIPLTGADPGFFLGGGALVSCSASTPINHIVFFLQNTSCIRKPQVISERGGGAHPLHPPPRSAPDLYCRSQSLLANFRALQKYCFSTSLFLPLFSLLI